MDPLEIGAAAFEHELRAGAPVAVVDVRVDRLDLLRESAELTVYYRR